MVGVGGAVAAVGVIDTLGFFCGGGVPGPIVEASSMLLILEAEVLVLLLVAMNGDGEGGGDGLISPWIGGCGSGGGVGPGSGII